MPHTLIIGYGNPLRGDDGFGWHAALRLRDLIQDPGVEILAVHQLTPELMDPVSRARRVIFIDAAVGEEPGKLTVAELGTTGGPAPVFTHFATPSGLLEGARWLYGAKPEALLITVVGLDFEIGEGLSEPVRAALESLAGGKIRELIGGAPNHQKP
jgi:hydrogenase maturation protease